MVKAVLMDIDDTILSFQGYVRESMMGGFEAFGIGPYQEEMLAVFHRINAELWHRLEEGTLSFETLKEIRWNLIFEALGIKADGVAFEAYFRDRLFDSAILVEGAAELLEYLKKKYILCAASNGPFLQQKNRLKRGGILDCFDHLFISEEIGFSKPSRAYFDCCLHRLNEKSPQRILPEEVVIIGDSSTSDLAGGIGAGLKTVYFNPQNRPLPQGMKADYTVETLDQIRAFL